MRQMSVIAALLVTFSAAVVWAGDNDLAARYINEGKELATKGDLDGFIRAYEQAYAITRAPEILKSVAKRLFGVSDVKYLRLFESYCQRYLQAYESRNSKPEPDLSKWEAKITDARRRINELEVAGQPSTPSPSPTAEPTPTPPTTIPPPPEPRRPNPSPGFPSDSGARRKVGIGLLTGGLILSIGGAVLFGVGTYDSTSADGPESNWNAALARGPAEITGGAVTAGIGVVSVIMGIVLLTKDKMPAGTAIMPAPGGGQFVVRF